MSNLDRLCIVTYASGPERFSRGVARLIYTARCSGFGGAVFAFSECDRTFAHELFPKDLHFGGLGWPWNHRERMYAWKAECIRRAWAMGHTMILYLDSSVVVQHSLAPVADFIADYGRLWSHSGFKCAEWTSDRCLDLMGMKADEAANVDMLLGGLIGLDLTHPSALDFFSEYWSLAVSPGAPAVFNGSHANRNGEVSSRPECRGHRHDQSVMSIVAYRRGWIPNDPNRNLIGYQSWPGDMDAVPLCVRPLP